MRALADQSHTSNSAKLIGTRLGLDLRNDFDAAPLFIDLNRNHSSVVIDGDTDYSYLEIEYRQGSAVEAPLGYRAIWEVEPGRRTDVAYFLGRQLSEYNDASRSSRYITVLQGSGRLVVGKVVGKGVHSYEAIASVRLDAQSEHAEAVMPAGYFYALRADAASATPLVVSSLYSNGEDPCTNQVMVAPSDAGVVMEEGRVPLPPLLLQWAA